MPTYDFQCHGCSGHFSLKQRIDEYGRDPVKCPECGSAEVERVITPSYPRTARKS
jgi:putative FmdB family regulatory protein